MPNILKLRKSVLVSCLFGAIFLAACSTSNVVETATETMETEVVPTATTRVALTLPTDTPEVVDECVACHTDKQRLIDSAKPEEETVSENEGAG